MQAMESKPHVESRRLIIQLDVKDLGLIRDAMAATKIFNRSEFIRLACRELSRRVLGLTGTEGGDEHENREK